MAIAVVTGCSTGIAQASAYLAPANCMKFNEASTTTTRGLQCLRCGDSDVVAAQLSAYLDPLISFPLRDI